MGRYYNGDIEGKFWFGVQSSDDAVNFGAVETEPNYIDYYVDNLEAVEEGLKEARDELGVDEQRLNGFFEKHDSYNDQMIIKYYKETFDEDITERQLNSKLTLLARLDLGEKIYKVVKENGYCSFSAEL
jgi:hypothetical protein